MTYNPGSPSPALANQAPQDMPPQERALREAITAVGGIHVAEALEAGTMPESGFLISGHMTGVSKHSTADLRVTRFSAADHAEWHPLDSDAARYTAAIFSGPGVISGGLQVTSLPGRLNDVLSVGYGPNDSSVNTVPDAGRDFRIRVPLFHPKGENNTSCVEGYPYGWTGTLHTAVVAPSEEAALEILKGCGEYLCLPQGAQVAWEQAATAQIAELGAHRRPRAAGSIAALLRSVFARVAARRP